MKLSRWIPLASCDIELIFQEASIKNPNLYKLVCEAIALGHNSLNDIREYMEVQSTKVNVYLDNLRKQDLITRCVPVTKNATDRIGRYYLADNFMKFWFRFIYSHLSGWESKTYGCSQIQAEMPDYLDHILHKAVKDLLLHPQLGKLLLQKQLDVDFEDIGPWWDKKTGKSEVEFAVVGYNKNPAKPSLFVVCKHMENLDSKSVLTPFIPTIKSISKNPVILVVAPTFTVKQPKKMEHIPMFYVDFAALDGILKL